MTVLFGTVEYFEREFEYYLAEVQKRNKLQDEIDAIHSKLKNEIMHDFICDENLREECLQNLSDACNKLTENLLV
ncbi:MAG TPA: hypothetical protein DCR24_00775 [Bacillus bacterium]|nr:hypothetical protein [Bacillus sp. (in: firmicutes)]